MISSPFTMHVFKRLPYTLPILLILIGFLCFPVNSVSKEKAKFKRIQTQFIAALGSPTANSGDNADLWGLWRVDPGPRGVMLDKYEQLSLAKGLAPAKWMFDDADWWVEEHGLIMEKPDFPLPAGKYVVTGDREVTTVLTVYSPNKNGKKHWKLDQDISLYDVTHLPCRAARYTPKINGKSCTPVSAKMSEFPVSPGASMPPIEGCSKQDYAVLFVIGVAVDNN